MGSWMSRGLDLAGHDGHTNLRAASGAHARAARQSCVGNNLAVNSFGPPPGVDRGVSPGSGLNARSKMGAQGSDSDGKWCRARELSRGSRL